MARSGVQSMRVVFAWSQVQPFRSSADVPVGERAFFVRRHGIPTDFRPTDRLVRAAARVGIDVLPVVQVAPDWAARHPLSFADPARYGSPPARNADYARFLRTLVERYGPRGDFWRLMPAAQRRPIRRWQVWNEPMIPKYWSDQPFARAYAGLLRAAYRAVHRADPGALVVMAGLPNLNNGGAAWVWLEKLYRAGAKGSFDVLAVHPWAQSAANVLRTVLMMRRVARGWRDRSPILVTEIGWSMRTSLNMPSLVLGSTDATVQGQARRLRATFRLLAAARKRLGIAGVFWATWLSPGGDPSDWTRWNGLCTLSSDRIVRTPALAAFRAVSHELEGRIR